MRQQVDLLVDELKPRREHLSLRQLVVVWGAFAGMLLAASSWQGFGLWRLAAEQAEQETRWQELSRGNGTLRASFNPAPEPELIRDVEALRRRLDDQALLVEAVKRYELARDGGFSRYLEDLAARHVDGLALSRIELHDGGSHVLLSGETVAPVNVPLFLRRLSEGDSFRGHRFDELRLEAQETGLLHFEITGPERKRQG